MTPVLSVIIPCYNAGAELSGAIESIRNQDRLPATEVIIVDDGSTDGSIEAAKLLHTEELPVEVISQANAGPAAARNTGIRAAKGAIIGFLDADDRWPANKLDLQLPRLENDSELQIVLGRIQYHAVGDAKLPDLTYDRDHTLVHVHLGSGLYRRRIFDQLGFFNERFRYHEDQDWFLRAREQKVKLVILDDITLYYRLHDTNMTHQMDMRNTGITDLIKLSLDRRRKQSGQAGQLKRFTDHLEKSNE